MSRVGRRPVPIPSGVAVSVGGGMIRVKGPKGELSRPVPPRIEVSVEGAEVAFARPDDKPDTRALHGLARALTANMVTGVTTGFTRGLEIEGVGYRADVKGSTLNLSLGFSHPVSMQIPKGLAVQMDGNTRLRIEGIDKELVGQFAANIRALRPPEPYKGKGIRYAGERIRRKVGKTGA